MTHETTYSITGRPQSRLVLQSIDGRMGTFLDKSCPHHCVIKCPMTSEFIIAHAERSGAELLPCESAARWAYDALCAGDQGQSRHVLEAINKGEQYENVIMFKKKGN